MPSPTHSFTAPRFLAAGAAGPSAAETITVDTLDDDETEDGAGSLRETIKAVRMDAAGPTTVTIERSWRAGNEASSLVVWIGPPRQSTRIP